MPCISQFYGIKILMYYNDHAPPHFHAAYASDEAEFAIDTLNILVGGLPRRSLALVLEWASLHREELRENWQRARVGQTLVDIPPLD
jgi:hypothetical protein